MSSTPLATPLTFAAATEDIVADPGTAAIETLTASDNAGDQIVNPASVVPPSGAVAPVNEPTTEVTAVEETQVPAWYQFTCTDAVVDASSDGIKSAEVSASSAMRAVLTNSDNMWEPGTVRSFCCLSIQVLIFILWRRSLLVLSRAEILCNISK